MRKQEEDENAANHDNRSLTPRLKQFKNDEMGTTRKGRSHLCFKASPIFYQITVWRRQYTYLMKQNRVQLNLN